MMHMFAAIDFVLYLSDAQPVCHEFLLETVLAHFIHSQALVVQDGPLASLFGVS
jgi:hypothetical protein